MHTKSIEDINWCPYNPNIVATCSADSTFKLFDLRASKPVLSKQFPNKANVDINVLSWNRLTPSLIAFGLDDGSV